MITVEEALEIVARKTIATQLTKSLLLSDSLGNVLAENVLSPITMPPFPQSAMDGYAVNCQNEKSPFTLVGEVAAGQPQDFVLEDNEAVRIFTGAEVPSTANMVIRQEDVVQNNTEIEVKVFPRHMANIRPLGEQILKDELAIAKGESLNVASIGFLASLGVKYVKVFSQPKVAIIATGSELIPVGQSLKPGQIYDSNSIMLKTALEMHGFRNSTIFKIEDDYNLTVKTIKNCLENYDVLVCSGGISVGNYDFIGKAFEENNVISHFYKVKQKPGKPLFFGQKSTKYVFGLPGNPAACLTGFNIYILPFLNKLKGGKFEGLSIHQAKLSKSYSRKGDRAEFLKGRVEADRIEILDGQSSAMLQSFASANAIIYIPIDRLYYEEGEWVNYYVLK